MRLALALALLALTPASALARTVDLTASSSGRTVTLHKGDKVVVRLAANATTGYHWSTTARPDKAVVHQTSSKYVPKPTQPGIVGSGGTQVIRFTATGQGATRFATAYLSPGTPHRVGKRFRLRFAVH